MKYYYILTDHSLLIYDEDAKKIDHLMPIQFGVSHEPVKKELTEKVRHIRQHSGSRGIPTVSLKRMKEITDHAALHGVDNACDTFSTTRDHIYGMRQKIKNLEKTKPIAEHIADQEENIEVQVKNLPITDYMCPNQECNLSTRGFKSNLPAEKALCPQCHASVIN